MAQASQFAALPVAAARSILVLLIALLAASLWPAVHMAPPKAETHATGPATTQERDADLDLYEAIIHRVRAGEPYHAAAADEQRHRGYPLQPFVTMRLPSLALLIANLGHLGAFLLEIGIVIAALQAWRRKLGREGVVSGHRFVLLAILALGLIPVFSRHYLTLHEIWAGALISLSIGLYRPEKWLPSVLVAGCALAVRELALPFVLLMAAFALGHRRWPELAGWTCLILAFAVLLAWHFQAVDAVVLPNDPRSPPWMLLGGPSAALEFFWRTSPLRGISALISYPIIILSLFGWAAWKSQTGLLGLLLLLGYMVAFMLTGRPNTFYWGLLMAPLLLIGLSFARTGLQDLINASRAPKLDLRRD